MDLPTNIFGTNIWFVLSFLAAMMSIGVFIYSVLKKEQEIHEHETDAQNKYQHILKKAHDQARSLMYTTSLASGELLKDVHTTSEHIDADLDKVLQGIAQKHIEYLKHETDTFNKNYSERLKQIEEQFNQTTQQFVVNSEQRINQSLDQFIQPVLKQMTDAQASIERRTHEIMEQTEKEIAEYKAAKMATVEKQVEGLLSQTYRDVLQRSIPESLHEELIMQSLERAKAEKMLDI